MMNLHPDDVVFFHEVCIAMRNVAKRYELPLRSISAATMPSSGMQSFLGRCHSTGDIELVMRATVDGVFCDAPRTPADVWRTAAHELAHLRHMNHGLAFEELHAELMIAIDNQQEDHKEKMIKKLVKMQASRDSEQAIGNSAAAEAFASAINRMLIEYELNPSDLDYARATDADPIIEMRVDLLKYQIEKKKTRVAWQESLARVVAKAHLCTFLLSPGSNNIWFVGTKSHAMVAEYVFGTLVPAAARMSYIEYRRFRQATKPVNGKYSRPETHGFIEAWLDAFITRITERFDDARKSMITEIAVDMPGASSQALIRLDGAMMKVQTYIDDKFKSGRRGASPLSRGRSSNVEGAARGRAAANNMTIGRRAVTGSASVKGLLK
jgi:hypothetical protein